MKNKLSQVEFAKKADLPRSTITRFENGNCNPTLNNLKKIAKALDMELRIEFVPIGTGKS
jgi:transcriptional regulator with XRE-family HTH domain